MTLQDHIEVLRKSLRWVKSFDRRPGMTYQVVINEEFVQSLESILAVAEEFVFTEDEVYQLWVACSSYMPGVPGALAAKLENYGKRLRGI